MRLLRADQIILVAVISIHAPREGCDKEPQYRVVLLDAISIHAPREGCDNMIRNEASPEYQFQSTHTVRGATGLATVFQRTDAISIHAPRERCDGLGEDARGDRAEFQSTHPVRGAT